MEKTFNSRCSALLGPAVLGVPLLLAACVSSPKHATKGVDLPDAPESWVAGGGGDSFEATGWAKDFRDPRLEALIDEALERNFSLKSAWSRLAAAEQTARIEGAAIWPGLTAGHSGARSQRNNSDGINRISSRTDTFGLTARVSWELDLWGGVRNTARAGLAEFEASREDYRAARLSLAARVASAWFDSLEAEQQLALAQRTLDTYQRNLEVVEESFRRGLSSALDVHLIRANVAAAKSACEQRVRLRDAFARQLEILLGRYPKAEISLQADLPENLGQPSAGVPAELLLRRPDLKAAERRLAAANERAAAAFKARLPSLSLTATGGTSTNEFGPSFEVAKNQIWSLAYSLSQTLFQGGRLQATDLRARAVYQAAADAYVGSVLVAYQEVENALESDASLVRDVDAQKVAAEESIAAEEVAWDQYQRGLTGIITAIEAQRRSITAQRSLLQATNDRVQARIDLYLALGGGLEVAPDEKAVQQSK